MKIGFTKEEWGFLNLVSFFTDLIPENGTFKNNLIEIEMTIDDWDELNGFVAAEANHAETQTLQDGLDLVHEKIEISILQQN